MAKTVRRYSVCHIIDTSTTFTTFRASEIIKEFPGFRWSSKTHSLARGRDFLSTAKLVFTLEPEEEGKTVKVVVTLTNRIGEKFSETYHPINFLNLGYSVSSYHDARDIGTGEEIIPVTLTYDIEITGVFDKVEKPATRDFGLSEPLVTDVVLVAGGQKFHVNKSILSTYSPFFQNLLVYKKAEYELDITPKALQELLQVIYLVPEIYDDNVEELFETARKYDVPLVTEILKKYIEGPTCFIADNTKEELVREYNLELFVPVVQKDFGFHGNLDDVVLKVENQRFHVNRGILATHSSYFRTMFFGLFRESKQDEIELKYVDPAAFQSLLKIIYHSPNIIHEDNVESLLDLSRMYDIEAVAAQCIKFLDGDDDLPMEEKLRLTEEYFDI